MRPRILLIALLVLALGAWVGAGSFSAVAQDATPAASPDTSQTFTVGGVVATPLTLTVADLQGLGLASQTVEATYQSGGEEETHSFTGVLLVDLLNQVGVPADPEARNPLLTYYVVVTANDGYQVVFSGGELDPNFGNTPIMVAWEQDGAALTGEDGPVRIAVPGDTRGGRYIYGVVSIDLLTIAAPAGAQSTPASS